MTTPIGSPSAAVRQIFSQPEYLQATLTELVRNGRLPATLGHVDALLNDVAQRHGMKGIIEAAYRYARHEPGVDVVLFGTGNIAHLQSNIQSILADPLPASAVDLVRQRLGHLVGVGLDAPRRKAVKLLNACPE